MRIGGHSPPVSLFISTATRIFHLHSRLTQNVNSARKKEMLPHHYCVSAKKYNIFVKTFNGAITPKIPLTAKSLIFGIFL